MLNVGPAWVADAVVYHVYALGACGAPRRNPLVGPPVARLGRIIAELDRIADLGATALLVGPLFEAASHGYDTLEYRVVDRRLGDAGTLELLSAELASRGMRLLVDAVLNHVGRGFWAFQDVLAKGAGSDYADWFHIDFAHGNRLGDGLSYQGWSGSTALVNLNLDAAAVRAHLLEVAAGWVSRFGISGLRLDAANVMSPDFLAALAARLRQVRPDIWLVAEIVMGDYASLARPGMLDSATNYEAYHALWTSHRNHDYHALAAALDREFGPRGVYRDLALLNFADNHDVDRIASSVADPAQLYPLYGLLFTLPGVPAVYYGSEWGIPGERTARSDRHLRPALDAIRPVQADLPAAIARFAALRRACQPLRTGDLRVTHVAAEQLVFTRSAPGRAVVVAVNNSASWAWVPVPLRGRAWDHLEGAATECVDGWAAIPPHWLVVLE